MQLDWLDLSELDGAAEDMLEEPSDHGVDVLESDRVGLDSPHVAPLLLLSRLEEREHDLVVKRDGCLNAQLDLPRGRFPKPVEHSRIDGLTTGENRAADREGADGSYVGVHRGEWAAESSTVETTIPTGPDGTLGSRVGNGAE